MLLLIRVGRNLMFVVKYAVHFPTCRTCHRQFLSDAMQFKNSATAFCGNGEYITKYYYDCQQEILFFFLMLNLPK